LVEKLELREVEWSLDLWMMIELVEMAIFRWREGEGWEKSFLKR